MCKCRDVVIHCAAIINVMFIIFSCFFLSFVYITPISSHCFTFRVYVPYPFLPPVNSLSLCEYLCVWYIIGCVVRHFFLQFFMPMPNWLTTIPYHTLMCKVCLFLNIRKIASIVVFFRLVRIDSSTLEMNWIIFQSLTKHFLIYTTQQQQSPSKTRANFFRRISSSTTTPADYKTVHFVVVMFLVRNWNFIRTVVSQKWIDRALTLSASLNLCYAKCYRLLLFNSLFQMLWLHLLVCLFYILVKLFFFFSSCLFAHPTLNHSWLTELANGNAMR